MENKTSIGHENGNDANRLLAAAASWWDNLTTFKRGLYIGRHYSDDTPTPDKINTLYKMYNDWSNDDLEQVSSYRQRLVLAKGKNSSTEVQPLHNTK